MIKKLINQPYAARFDQEKKKKKTAYKNNVKDQTGIRGNFSVAVEISCFTRKLSGPSSFTYIK
jgi:hypothetical protein